jgi:hypothetical protein
MRNRNLNAAVWLIGIGTIALFNYWWPGILLVLAASMLVNGRTAAGLITVGVAVLFEIGIFWPGILIVVGLGLLLGGLLPGRKTESVFESDDQFITPEPEEIVEPLPEAPAEEAAAEGSAENAPPERDANWLPETCPACGGPWDPETVIWHADDQVECPYCHAAHQKESIEPE